MVVEEIFLLPMVKGKLVVQKALGIQETNGKEMLHE